jgi:hypothetical protein
MAKGSVSHAKLLGLSGQGIERFLALSPDFFHVAHEVLEFQAPSRADVVVVNLSGYEQFDHIRTGNMEGTILSQVVFPAVPKDLDRRHRSGRGMTDGRERDQPRQLPNSGLWPNSIEIQIQPEFAKEFDDDDSTGKMQIRLGMAARWRRVPTT